MEARTCAAGDRNEQKRKEQFGNATAANRRKAGKGIDMQHGMGNEHTHEAKRHHRIKKIGVKVVARLQKKLDRASKQ